MLAQETLHTLRKKKVKEGLLGINLDINKAYDLLEWSFIARVLEANGFCERFINMIMHCISSIRFSILLNGSPLSSFYPKKGIRQGDLFSPYIFIL